MTARRWAWLHIAIAAAVLTGGAAALAAPAGAAVRPPVVKPSMTLHYVGNCTDPTVEAGFYKLTGPKDVYARTDQGVWLVATSFVFDPAKVYDGYWHMGGVYQVDLYVTNPGAGPYANHLVGKSTAATALCPTYYPTYDSHWVKPTPPAGSYPITFDYLAWWPNRD
jgi:hypothetical protein